MLALARPRRPRRTGEWTETAAVTFIVTLAATRSVTLAAARSGMSRKSAYALKARDSAFAAAWAMAAAAGNGDRRQGDKAHKAREPRNSPGQGDAFAAAVARALDPMPRHSLFRGPRKRGGESPPAALARTPALP